MTPTPRPASGWAKRPAAAPVFEAGYNQGWIARGDKDAPAIECLMSELAETLETLERARSDLGRMTIKTAVLMTERDEALAAHKYCGEAASAGIETINDLREARAEVEALREFRGFYDWFIAASVDLEEKDPDLQNEFWGIFVNRIKTLQRARLSPPAPKLIRGKRNNIRVRSRCKHGVDLTLYACGDSDCNEPAPETAKCDYYPDGEHRFGLPFKCICGQPEYGAPCYVESPPPGGGSA